MATGIRTPYLHHPAQYVVLETVIEKTGVSWTRERIGMSGTEIVARTFDGFFNVSLMKAYLYKQRLYYDNEYDRYGTWFSEGPEYTLMPGESFNEKYLAKKE